MQQSIFGMTGLWTYFPFLCCIMMHFITVTHAKMPQRSNINASVSANLAGGRAACHRVTAVIFLQVARRQLMFKKKSKFNSDRTNFPHQSGIALAHLDVMWWQEYFLCAEIVRELGNFTSAQGTLPWATGRLASGGTWYRWPTSRDIWMTRDYWWCHQVGHQHYFFYNSVWTDTCRGREKLCWVWAKIWILHKTNTAQQPWHFIYLKEG